MAKATKVQDSDSDSDEEDDLTKEELITMLEQLKTCYFACKKECKGLRKDKNSLEQELNELKASHECLKEDHENLQLAHTKLEKAHSSLTEQVVVSCDIGVTCDLIEESFYTPIVVAPTNPSCSTSTPTSSTSDPSLLVENKSLKEEVKKLNHTLAKAYGGEDRLLMCLGSQRASLHKEGLGYIPKKGQGRLLLLTRLVL
jgi:DNA repair exonuclease SbcCD ATPase subunit